jgi:hypothetical protein
MSSTAEIEILRITAKDVPMAHGASNPIKRRMGMRRKPPPRPMNPPPQQITRSAAR